MQGPGNNEVWLGGFSWNSHEDSSEFKLSAQDILVTGLIFISAHRLAAFGQGSQFTAMDFVGVLKRHEICISMDGRGSWRDNVFVERLWRSIKYE
jgi:transposase InsO family protein